MYYFGNDYHFSLINHSTRCTRCSHMWWKAGLFVVFFRVCSVSWWCWRFMWLQRLNLAARHRKSHASHHGGMFIYKKWQWGGTFHPVTTFCVVNWSFKAQNTDWYLILVAAVAAVSPHKRSRRQKIDVFIDTNHNNFQRNLKTDWTLIQYFNNAANNVNCMYIYSIYCLYAVKYIV